jgi:hypothetical protein
MLYLFSWQNGRSRIHEKYVSTVRALSANVDTNGSRLKLLASGQKAILEKLTKLEAAISSAGGFPGIVSSPGPTIAGAIYQGWRDPVLLC